MPEVVNFGDPDAILNDLPTNFKEQANQTAKSLFDSAKMGFLSSLSNFGPSLFLNAPKIPTPGSEGYNEESAIIVSSILENLKIFSAFVESIGEEQSRDSNLIKQLNFFLHQIYETTKIQRCRVLATYQLTLKLQSTAYLQNIEKCTIINLLCLERYLFLTLRTWMTPRKKQYFLKPVGYSESSFFGTEGSPPDERPLSILGMTFGGANGQEYEPANFDSSGPSMASLEKRGTSGPISNLDGFSFQNI